MIAITTNHRTAKDSLDHIHPGATAFDNSVYPPFNAKVFQLFQEVRLLDIGCAGGGLVESINAEGGFAVGIEGSDYSKKLKRAAWGGPHAAQLFTADATKPFFLHEKGRLFQFNIITCWECLEHIPSGRIDGVLNNVANHLEPGGAFVVSITTGAMGLSELITLADGTERPAGIEYHVTVRPPEWWIGKLTSFGFQTEAELTDFISPDWVRGPSTGVANSLCLALSLP